MTDIIAPTSPGRMLAEEFIEPNGLTQYGLAKAIGVDPMRISEIVRGKRAISADTALRLARYFGNSELFWLNLQDHYDLEIERDKLRSALDAIEPLQPS